MSSVAKQKEAIRGGFFSGLFQVGMYKPNQGRIVRQVTFFAALILVLMGAWEVANWDWFSGLFDGSRYMMFAVLGGIGAWVCFRLVNWPSFADFMIAVEAEMKKVSWPGKQELWRASLVVIFVIFAMALLLFVFDIIWTWLFEWLRVRYSGG